MVQEAISHGGGVAARMSLEFYFFHLLFLHNCFKILPGKVNMWEFKHNHRNCCLVVEVMVVSSRTSLATSVSV